MIFITMKNDPGSIYWISDIEDGAFQLNLKENSHQEIEINYLVENARQANSYSIEKKLKKDKDPKQFKEENPFLKDTENENFVIKTIRPDMNPEPPSLPENLEDMYKWSIDKGVEFVGEIQKKESLDKKSNTKK